MFHVLGEQVVHGSDGSQSHLLVGIREVGEDRSYHWLEVFGDLPALLQLEADRLQTLQDTDPVPFVQDVCLRLGQEVSDQGVKFGPSLLEQGSWLFFLHHLDSQLLEVSLELLDPFGASRWCRSYLARMRS